MLQPVFEKFERGYFGAKGMIKSSFRQMTGL